MNDCCVSVVVAALPCHLFEFYWVGWHRLVCLCYAFCLCHWLAGGWKTRRLCKRKKIPDWGSRDSEVQARPLGSAVGSVGSVCSLICYPSHTSDPLVSYFQWTWNAQIRAYVCTYVLVLITLICLQQIRPKLYSVSPPITSQVLQT
jgi:hypothetical protein